MRKDIAVAAVAVLIVLAVCFGLAAAQPNLPPVVSQPFVPAADGSSSTSKAVSGKVVMRVNGEAVTQREFEAFLSSAPAESRSFYATPAGKRAMADELVKLKSLEQEARRLGVTSDPAVQTQIDIARSQITAGKALEKLIKDTMEMRIRGEYERQRKVVINLRHILVAVQGGQIPARNGAALPEAAAMQKAAALATRIRGGADFAEVARAQSDHAETAQRGGSLGPTRMEMLPPEIAAVVSRLKPGEVSDPVRTQLGVHIFQVTEPTLEELRPLLSQQMQQQAIEETVSRLQRAAKVDLDPSYFPPAAPRGASPKAGS
ncbi:MAG TPA: peptidylprolyl isomerase [Thermoanaerobaculia bacterium]